MVPDFTLPASYMYPGRILRAIMWGRISTVSTNTMTLQAMWGGTAGISLGTSGAITLASGTTLPFTLQYFITCRAVGSGTSGSLMCQGLMSCLAATVAIGAVWIPASAPAAVGVDTTTAKALDFNVTFSSSTTNAVTVHQYLLEAIS